MNYKTFLVSRYGGPEELQLVERHLRAPAQDEARIRVLAATASRPDVSVRRGEALYSGAFLGQKLPFTPGYAVIGEVEAVGEHVRHVAVGARVGVLTVVGGYTEMLYWRADRRRGKHMISFGEPASRGELLRILGLALRTKVTPNGKSLSLYGTSTYFLFDQKSYLEDWATLFQWLEAGKIKPVIAARFPILEAAQANALLESGEVIGNVVLVAPGAP
jgi:NADPH:quinone reductase-like Zn-dependent oxidoreductase